MNLYFSFCFSLVPPTWAASAAAAAATFTRPLGQLVYQQQQQQCHLVMLLHIYSRGRFLGVAFSVVATRLELLPLGFRV